MTENSTPSSWVQTVSLTPPSLEDNVADADRVAAALRERWGVDRVTWDLDLLRALPAKLRAWEWSTRCVGWRCGDELQLCALAPPGKLPRLTGAAIDLGTTRAMVRCVDLESGEVLAEAGFDNPQIDVAPDILARIHHADSPSGIEELRRLIIAGLNDGLARACARGGADIGDLSLVTIAGNTAMTHLVLGLEPRWIIREPYIPAANTFGLFRARDLGLLAGGQARVYLFPNIGSYFGGDLIAGILSSGLHRREELSLLVDVGTNAEVVIGNREWLLACAGAAGPALEGGAATMGMLAGPGVIDRCTTEVNTGEIEVHTIGDEPPLGICGSGLIDLAACLFRTGAIDIRGVLVPEVCGERWIEVDGVGAYVVVPKETSASGEALTLSQPELDSLVRSKAAMFTILETLTAAVGLTPKDLSTFSVAGTFGSYIDPRSAITIGMLPDLPADLFNVLGNSSLEGATLALTSPERAAEIDGIRDAITYLELNVNQDFMNRFSAAKFLPHTDPGRFPSVEVPPQRG